MGCVSVQDKPRRQTNPNRKRQSMQSNQNTRTEVINPNHTEPNAINSGYGNQNKQNKLRQSKAASDRNTENSPKKTNRDMDTTNDILERYNIRVQSSSAKVLSINSYQYQPLIQLNPTS